MSFSSDDFAKALEQHDYQFQRGQIIRGKVFAHDSNGAYIDIGGKSAAFLPAAEASLKSFAHLEDAVPIDTERDFIIIREQDADGQVTVSIRQLELERIWEELAELQESKASVQVRVTGVNKGGVTVDFRGVRGFVPRSHLVDKGGLESLVGHVLTSCVLELERDRRRLVLSEKLATQAASFSQLMIGQLVEGTVTGIKPFGIFLSFQGSTGLLHINQISKNYVSNLDTLFQIGQPLKAVIIDLDSAKKRISLSTKLLEKHPGEMLESIETVMTEASERLEKALKTMAQEGNLGE